SYVPAPHAPYSVGAELFRRIFAAAARTGRPTTVHVAEGQGALALLLDGEGPWVEILESMGVPRGSRTPGLRPVPYPASLGAATGAQALGLDALGSLAPGQRPGIIDVGIDDLAAPLPALVRNPTPRVRWMARA